MKIVVERSLAGLLESVLFLGWAGAWLVALAFAVLPFLGAEQTTFRFGVQVAHGLAEEKKEGPGGTWTLQPVVAQVSTPHDRTWIASLVAVPFVVLIAYVLGQLRAIFGSLQTDAPFIAGTARRLRRVGAALLLYEGLRVAITLTVIAPAIESLRPLAGGAVIQASAFPHLGLLFLAAAVLVLADVFRRGARLQDEQDLTV